MGGALILVAIVISTLLWADLSNRFVWMPWGVFIFGAVGWVDDWRKVVEKNPRGLPASGSICGYQWVRWGRRLRCSLTKARWKQLIVPFFKTWPSTWAGSTSC